MRAEVRQVGQSEFGLSRSGEYDDNGVPELIVGGIAQWRKNEMYEIRTRSIGMVIEIRLKGTISIGRPEDSMRRTDRFFNKNKHRIYRCDIQLRQR
jgi:hypothetical protein